MMQRSLPDINSSEEDEGSATPMTTCVIPHRRVTLFERTEIVKMLTPSIIGAIQRELVELRMEIEDRCEDRVSSLLRMSARERLMQQRSAAKVPSSEAWETASSDCSRSFSRAPVAKDAGTAPVKE